MMTKLAICLFAMLFIQLSVQQTTPATEICSQAPDAGSCRGVFPRFYYDPVSGTCAEFFYGGCGGNSNNFLTVEDCQALCKPARK
ncbi:PI-stichotoxin-She2a-like [Physella acuta]|uniref:PI-stichotoxin-She2a-like n=1 Tax=Physella acuta TaxID=109671 RepID=UPI0027DE9C4E|nr:PI-stichotoxin-She2a-like [Physella acuta]